MSRSKTSTFLPFELVRPVNGSLTVATQRLPASFNDEPKPAPKECRDPLNLARHYQSLLDSGKFESQAGLARYLGVSRARVTQVLRRLR
jgi:hypothetical protein